MRSCRIHRSHSGMIFAMVLPVLVCPNPHGFADTLPAPEAEAASNPALTLSACRQIALGNQPTLAATRASLQAALDRVNALENLRVPACLARDLPIRRQQAALGVTIAQGGIAQAEAETIHGVTSSYLAALYAAQQIKLAEDEDPDRGIQYRLKALQTLVNDENLRRRRRDVMLPEHQKLVQSFLETFTGRIQEARQGKLRALAALREAMGVGADFIITLPDGDLPCPRVQPELPALVAAALARRGEMIQAAGFANVVCLEIDAQAASCRPSVKTFASSSDIHAKPIPTGDLGGVNYRPAIVGPEMPAFLNGSRAARVQQAHDYHERARALVAKTRNLITLEVEDLYRRWVNKSTEAAHLEKAYQDAKAFSGRLQEIFKNSQKGDYPNLDELINAGLNTTRLQLEWKEAHYQALLALAALERATGGGFAVDFDAAPACASKENRTPAHQNHQP
jgi:outer membrane protein TolC